MGSAVRTLRQSVLAATLATALGTAGRPARAGEALSTEVSLDWLTDYVWRGMLLTNNPVIQPSVTLSAYGFSLNAWGSADVTDVNEDDGENYHWQETDYTASYSHSPLAGLDLTGGFVWYSFSGLESTGEVFGSVTLSSVPLSPSFSAYYDVDEADAWYLNGAVSHTFDLTERLGLTLSGGLGYGSNNFHEYYFGEAAHGSECDLSLKASLGYAMTESLSFCLYGGYAVLLDGQVRRLGEAAYGAEDTRFGGAGVCLSF
jgi:hypothetical protein